MAPLSAVTAPQFVRFPAAILRRSAAIPVWNHNYGNRRAIGEAWSLRVASRGWGHAGMVASHLCEREALTLDLDWKEIDVREASSEEELLAAIQLRIRTFYEFKQFYGVEDYTRHLMEREFEALKDRVYGKREEFKRVCCINASLPMSPSLSDASDLCSTCKFSKDGKDRVVIGTLDVNQCLKLADELTGMKPEGSGDNLTRAYLSNVCVASELHRNGLGYTIVAKAKKIALEWGITDLYVHVAADNEAAQKLYEKSGFIYENEEPAWQARFLGRPRRLLLWTDLTQTNM